MELHVVSVKDAFDIKAGQPGSSHDPGLVVVFDGRQCGFDLPPLGARIDLLRPDGTTVGATIGEMKEHGDGRSFFLGGLTRNDAPVGTILYWSQTSPATRVTQHAQSGV
ncbi:MAG: hypothetical protein ABSH20_22065 [Tepidisphaeraceae bacterium]|jgi:hypothetical protein